MSEKLTLARIKKFGKHFEVSVHPELALKFKKGEIKDVGEVLLSEHVYSDAKRGEIVSPVLLKECFNVEDTLQVAALIIKDGEIQATGEQRNLEREQKKRLLIETIHTRAVDPSSGFPHPAQRIESALEEGKISLDDYKSVEEQFDSIVAKLRLILPLKIERKKLNVEIPSQYAGKGYALVKKNTSILTEEWTTKGSWKVTVEIPAGFYLEFINLLNALCHGDVSVEVVS